MCKIRILLPLALVWMTSFGLAEPDFVSLGPFGGDVRSLAVHPQRPERFFLGTADGQIYVSEDTGESWRRLSPGLKRRNLVVDGLAFDPRDPQVLYASTWELKNDKGHLFRTRDGGESWENVALGNYQSSIRALAIAPSEPEVIALGITEGVILSEDGGASWDRISRGFRSLYHVNSLAFDPHDSQTLYAGTFRLGWKTNDRGKRWQAMHDGMYYDSDMFSIVVNPKQTSVVYSSACSGVYKSENGGLAWSRLRNGLPNEAQRTRSLSLDPAEPNTLYAGTVAGLFVSYDGGLSWSRLLDDVVINAIAVHPRNSQVLLLATDDSGILKSTDGGKTFRSSNQGFINRQISAVAVSPHDSRLFFAAVSKDRHHGGFFASVDGGATWKTLNEGLPGSAVSEIRKIQPSGHSKRVFLATSQGVFLGIPGEQPWSLLSSTTGLSVQDLSTGGANESELFLVSSRGVLRADLERDRVTPLNVPSHGGAPSAVLYDEATGLLYVGTSGAVFRSDDRGDSWAIKVKGFPPLSVNTLVKINGRLLAGTRQGIFFSEDHGENWTKAQGVFALDIVSIQSNPLADHELVAADFQVGYLFESSDGGANWKVMNPWTISSRISGVAFSGNGDLLAASASDGVYRVYSSTGLAAGR